MSALSAFTQWFHTHQKILKEAYFRFLKIPSISTDPAYQKQMHVCAEWLKDYLKEKVHFQAEVIPTEGHPLVYAEDLSAGPKAPTLLIYGHYDVQPVDPLELWDSPPFEPTIRNGLIYARGAVDDKGQIFFTILAMQAWKELGKKLPVNVKFCIEGEEETSSVGLAKALPHLKEKLQADALLVPDFGALDAETPALSLGARGILCLEVTITGSHADLHSGMYGGLAYNPNRALAELLAKCWDENGRVRIEGFYEGVAEPSPEELAQYAFRFDPQMSKQEFGIEAFGNEKGRSFLEANCFRPTFEINGISGGYTGVGFKTVIPAKATAKISCRLVPHQNPKKIEEAVVAFLKRNVHPGMKINVTVLSSEAAFRGDPDSSLAQAIAQAATEVTGKKCAYILSGGSIPIVAEMVRQIGVKVVGMGYGLAEDNIHAPNESFDWGRMEKGFLTVARAIECL